MEKKLIDYIKESKEKGFFDEEIRKALLGAGWEEKDIEEGFRIVSQPPKPEIASVEPTKPSSSISKLPGPIALLENAWSIYTQRIWVFAGILLIPIILYLLGYILGSLFLNWLTLGIATWKVFSLIIIGLLLMLAVFLVGLWGQVSLLYALVSKEKINIVEAYKRGKSKIFSYCWISILTALIIIAGVLLLAIPAIIFAVWFAFALFILVAENLKGTEALKKSKEYVKGRWWSVFLRIAAGWIMIFIPLISIIFLSTLSFELNWIDIDWLEIVIQAILSMLGFFASILLINYNFSIYKSLKEELTFTRAKKKTTILVIVAVIIGFLLILGSSGLLIIKGVKGARERGKDAVIKAALSEARVAAEEYYDARGNYSGVCTSNDFASIQDKIIDNGGSWTCNGKVYAYCVESSLSEGYWCIDHTGASKANTTSGCGAYKIDCSIPDPQMIARDNQRIEDLKKIADALELYHKDNDSYPVMEMCLEVHSDGFPTNLEDGSIKWDSLESILQAGGYINSLPEDPKKDPTSDYIYMYNSDDGTTYTLSALLEGWNDALNSDFDGRMGRCSFCNDPIYCIQSQK